MLLHNCWANAERTRSPGRPATRWPGETNEPAGNLWIKISKEQGRLEETLGVKYNSISKGFKICVKIIENKLKALNNKRSLSMGKNQVWGPLRTIQQ